jgi:PAS domain S-box-containing protein
VTSASHLPDVESLVQATRIAAVFLDGDGNLRSYTPAAAEIFDVQPGLVGQPLSRLRHFAKEMPALSEPLDGPREDEIELNDGRFFVRRAQAFTAPGTSRPGVALSFVEVTEIKRAEDRALRREAELRAVTDALPVLIAFVDREHRYRFHNQTYRRWFGEEAADVRGRSLVEVLGEKAYAKVLPHMEQAFGGRSVRFEAEMPYKFGPPRAVDISFVPLVGSDGDVRGIFTLVVDNGERRRLAVELAEAKHLAEQGNRAKNVFLAKMSHEMRTPLAAMLGYLDVLTTHLRDPDDLACADLVRRNGQHLQRIIHDLLDLAKVETGSLTLSPTTFAWRSIVEDVLALLRPRAKDKGLTTVVRAPGPLPDEITTDATRLRQILLNLVGNAIAFTSAGHVAVDVDWQPERRHLRFRVSDSGVGMSREQLARVSRPLLALGLGFEPIDAQGSAGLGLAISHHLASLLGDGLILESEPGQGTTVTFTVDPGRFDQVHWSSDEPASFASVTTEAPLRLDGRRVLLADDRREIRYLVQTFLEEAGAEVVSVADGADALEAILGDSARLGDLRSAPPTLASGAVVPFDAVVLDIEMPRLDGREAARLLRRAGYDGPLLALTAAAMKGEAARCLEAGFDAYLSKPVDRAHLVSTLRDLLQRRPNRAEGTSRDASAHAEPPLDILVVDDDPDAAESLAAFLEMEGYRVRTACDGETARRAVSHASPAIVLLDLTFPQETGYDILTSLAPDLAETNSAAVALSGHDATEERQRALRAGFRAYLTKPVPVEMLLTTVRQLLAARQAPPSKGAERRLAG